MDLQDEEEQGRVDVDPGQKVWLSMAELSGFISKNNRSIRWLIIIFHLSN